MTRLRLAVFGSGYGSNCRAIHQAISDRQLTAEITVIISDQEKAGILDFAKEQGIPAFRIASSDFASLTDFHHALLEILKQYHADMIILAGYMKKIGKPILRAYPNRVLNIHPALLPAFGGKGLYGKRVHQAVLDYGAKITGVTVHLVDEEYDHGPVVMQKAVPVLDHDTADSLAERVLQTEHELYPTAIRLFAENRVRIENRKVIIMN